MQYPADEIINRARDKVRYYLSWAGDGLKAHAFDCLEVPFPPDAVQVRLYLSLASKNAVAFEALLVMAEKFMAGPHVAPPELVEFVRDVRRGRRRRPKQKGRDRRANQVRNDIIREAIRLAVGEGLPPTRNDASEPISACDVVAEVLREHNVWLSYEAVAKLRPR